MFSTCAFEGAVRMRNKSPAAMGSGGDDTCGSEKKGLKEVSWYYFISASCW